MFYKLMIYFRFFVFSGSIVIAKDGMRCNNCRESIFWKLTLIFGEIAGPFYQLAGRMPWWQ